MSKNLLKLALATSLCASLALAGQSANNVASKDGKIDFGSKFEASILTGKIDGGWEMIWGANDKFG